MSQALIYPSSSTIFYSHCQLHPFTHLHTHSLLFGQHTARRQRKKDRKKKPASLLSHSAHTHTTIYFFFILSSHGHAICFFPMEVQTTTHDLLDTMTPTSTSTSTTIPTAYTSHSSMSPFNPAVSGASSTPVSANDPNPSWTFYPPSATYIPPSVASTPIPASSAGASSSSQATPSSPSPNGPSSPRSPQHPSSRSSPPPSSNASGSTPSTHHRILDHCFHLSIETRLKQAEAQYLASTQEQAVEQQQSPLKQDDWRRRQRSLVDEAVILGRKGSNVEAIVDGKLITFGLSTFVERK